MFSNQKKKFLKGKWFYGIIVLFLLAFGIWINTDTESQKANTDTKVEQETVSAPKEPSVVDSLGQMPSNEHEANENEANETKDAKEKTTEESTNPSEETQQPYYLIKEVEGVVKVFYCDEKGQETLHQITSVPFQLLSKEDQQMMSEGVRMETEEELASFLENFDS